ncbi:MAG: TerB family tellurite resistance protein [Bradymonadales bacterium]|nr:TerB family tellurite resistance protein [Bradymonadales bacterium]
MDRNEQNRLTFIKGLVGAVWLEKTITADLLNVLKHYLRRLNLSEEELVELKPILSNTLREREASRLVDAYLDLLPNLHPRERDGLGRAISDLIELEWSDSDDEVFLANLKSMLGYMRDIGSFLDKTRELLKNEGISPPEEGTYADNLDDFVRNRIMHTVKSKMIDLHIGRGELSAKEVAYITSLSALLGRIAHADEDFSKEEKVQIAALLKESTTLSPTDIDVIMETIVDDTLRGMDLKSITRTFYNLSNPTQRETLLNCLFLVAGADGHIDPSEVEEIERIAVSLNMSHRDILRAKSNAMQVVQRRMGTDRRF